MSSDVHIDRPGARFGRRDLLRTVAEGTAGAVGDEFLRCLVRHVALAFDAKFAFVAEAIGPERRARAGGQRLVRRRLDGRAVRVRHARQAVRAGRGAGGRRVPGGADDALPRGQAGDRHGPRELPRGLPARGRRHAPRPHGGDGRGADGGRGRRRRGDADLRVAGGGRARAPPSGGRVATLARACDRGRRFRAPARRARPARRRAAAARGGGESAHGGSAPARPRRSAGRRAAPRERGARRGAGRAARPRARAASGGALRARAAQRARIADGRVRDAGRRSTSRRTSCRTTSSSPRTSSSASRSRTRASTRTPARSGSASARWPTRSSSRSSDDGCGGADPARGTGLLGLADRVDALGGRLEVDSPPGAGTRVSARLPLAPPRS